MNFYTYGRVLFPHDSLKRQHLQSAPCLLLARCSGVMEDTGDTLREALHGLINESLQNKYV